jgi:hypothetical protein
VFAVYTEQHRTFAEPTMVDPEIGEAAENEIRCPSGIVPNSWESDLGRHGGTEIVFSTALRIPLCVSRIDRSRSRH